MPAGVFKARNRRSSDGVKRKVFMPATSGTLFYEAPMSKPDNNYCVFQATISPLHLRPCCRASDKRRSTAALQNASEGRSLAGGTERIGNRA